MRCRWTSTWRWSVLWNHLVLRSLLTVTLGLCCRTATWWILGWYSTRIPLAHHQFCPKFCIVMNSWTTPICLPRQYLIVDSRSSFQGITQNLKIRKLLRARDWRLLDHQPKINVSLKIYPVNWIRSMDLTWLSDYQLFRYVKHLFHCEIFTWIVDGM